jgi:hypothetical protein
LNLPAGFHILEVKFVITQARGNVRFRSFIREEFAMAGKLVNAGSLLTCTKGTLPSTLAVIAATTAAQGPPAANINDCVPVTNIPTFNMCNSALNPTVAAATAAALGVLTPMPCIPVTAAWTPGVATVLVRNAPALDDASKCTCAYGGQISITTPDAIVDAG